MASTGEERGPTEQAGRKLKSEKYFQEKDLWGFIHRSFTKSMGYTEEDLRKPVIGICNTFSELNKCHSHFNELVDYVKRGVWQAGGVPMEFPTISIGEPYIKPTSMLLRNLMAMDTEEMMKAHPIDGVVLIGGCDKTVPAQLMAAASVNIPAIVLTGGPMLNGRKNGRSLGACTDCYGFTLEHKAGNITDEELASAENSVCRSDGHCQVMGTASTMASIAEAIGMALPGNAAIPAPDSRRRHMAERTGKQIVELVRRDIRPRDIMTAEALENAIAVTMASGGSTNAIIHLVAISQRLGRKLPLEKFDEISSRTPFILNLRPSGKYQMEEYFEAGGVPALMKELESKLHLDCLTVTGRTIGENLEQAMTLDRDVIRTVQEPLGSQGGVVVLRGNLAPNGSLIKQTAVSEHLKKHTGKAVVFDSPADMEARIDDPDLDVDENSVLVLKNAGPRGAPAMPEIGQIPIPKKLLLKGVRDMVRISDARISGTSYGALIVHAAPEAAVGGNLALVRDGDEIELDIAARRLELKVDDEELAERRKAWKAPEPHYDRGYGLLFHERVLQADLGCDFDFLLPKELRQELLGGSGE
ncbi:IlvD/Edd family dehydratase [Cohnella thailandensis]|uniref:Dihydroxy-acid dehydratase n=1 Tax=Cohnella thailandensis TaxID=557557 RepID=A0A841SZC4_9BACL|nr:IlvD/Edd family dehydratase [Cohnella thailandensis]MBB6635986.1 dihydroxy-acid dehydratase [Cohnella thailandensis]MBP1976364.1 dihydroxy-acid dehydratase [Cohnella thailandensis]